MEQFSLHPHLLVQPLLSTSKENSWHRAWFCARAPPLCPFLDERGFRAVRPVNMAMAGATTLSFTMALQKPVSVLMSDSSFRYSNEVTGRSQNVLYPAAIHPRTSL